MYCVKKTENQLKMKQINCIKVYVCRNTYLYIKHEEMTGETEGERRKNIKKVN